MKSKHIIYACIAGALMLAAPAAVSADTFQGNRFFHDGDGTIHLKSRKNGSVFDGRYRRGPGDYDPKALAAIGRVFDVPQNTGPSAIALRLIAFLDFLQDHYATGAVITITSGYRSPSYNTNLRRKGALAAKASLHQYGMAADIVIHGVPSRRVWEFVKSLGFGGTGYYQGESVHVDVGPARSWDQRTSGVGTGISDDNKLIGVVTDFDRYATGEKMALRFIRMTAFPIGVSPQFALVSQEEPAQDRHVAVFQPDFSVAANGPCPQFADIDQMAGITWRLPADLPTGRYAVRVDFCDRSWTAMPAEIVTPAFDVVATP
jgi:uncharacterized protein YcbK (DUF882 family)